MSTESKSLPEADGLLETPECVSRFKLEQLFVGELAEEARAGLLAHVAGCVHCAARWEAVQATQTEFVTRFQIDALVADLEQRRHALAGAKVSPSASAAASSADAHPSLAEAFGEENTSSYEAPAVIREPGKEPGKNFLEERTVAFDSMQHQKIKDMIKQVKEEASQRDAERAREASQSQVASSSTSAASPLPALDALQQPFMDEKTTAFDPLRDGNLKAVLERARAEEADAQSAPAPAVTAELSPDAPAFKAALTRAQEGRRQPGFLSQPWLERVIERLREIFFRPVWAGMAIMAGVFALILVPALSPNQPFSPQYVGMRAGELAAPGPLEVFRLRGQEVEPARSGESFKPGDRLQFILHPGGYRFVHLVSLDEQGELSWYYPGTGDTSLKLGPDSQVMLPGSIELDNYLGRERIYAIYSEEELPYARIEAAVGELVDAQGRPLSLQGLPSLPLDGTVQVSFGLTKALR